MDNQTRLARLKETFDAASAGYDSPALRFFNHAADKGIWLNVEVLIEAGHKP